MKKNIPALILGVFLLMAPLTAGAANCESEIRSAEHNLRLALEKFPKVPEAKQPRIKRFLDDAKKLIAEAKESCPSAETLGPLEAMAKATIAQGNISAALLFIRDAVE